MGQTDGVNAGTDIEKELAERHEMVEGFTKEELQQIAKGGDVVVWPYPNKSSLAGVALAQFRALAAALLAEAGERAELKDALDITTRRAHGAESAYISAAQLASTEAERARGLEAQNRELILGAEVPISHLCGHPEGSVSRERCNFCSLEAGRVAALQAQLETAKEDITSLIGNASQYTSAAWIVDALDKILAALSQFPTPAQEKP